MKYDFYVTGTIGEEFDWWTGQRGTTADMVRDFLDKHKDQEVNLAVSSPGGYLNEGIIMAELIAAHGKCNMIIIGMTASAATVLCMKAKSVKIARGSLVLIHNSSQYISGPGVPNKQKIDAYIEKLKATRENLDTIDKAIADIYSGRNGKTIEENMAMMSKEKWMTAEEAVEFGIVDDILEDEEVKTETKAIQNFYASKEGLEEHFALPKLPVIEKAEEKIPKGIMAKIKEMIDGLKGSSDNNNQKPSEMNKTFITVNALLKVEGLNESADGVVMTTEQVQVIEDNLAELQGKVENQGNLESQVNQLTTDKENAETAKAEAETKLANLQKEFDDFKAQAGEDTKLKPSSSAAHREQNYSSAEMFNEIKDIL